VSNLNISNVGQMIKEAKDCYLENLKVHGISDPQVIVNNSGGKDSGATDLLAFEILEGNYRSVAADTGNEHPWTIDHLKSLHMQRDGSPVEIVSMDYEQALFDKRKEKVIKGWAKKQKIMAGAYRGIIMPSLTRTDTKFAEVWRGNAKRVGWGDYESPIHAFKAAFVRSGNPFLDMSLLHGGFPLGRNRYCTDELKIQVVFDKVLSPLLDEGKEIVQWSGVRGDKSEDRANYNRFEVDRRDEGGFLFNFLPIHKWSAQDVFAVYKHFGVKPNPLYTHGMSRVGCMPCVLVNKEELAEIAARFPEEIERVSMWESQVAKTSRWIHWMISGHVNRRQFKRSDKSKIQFGMERVFYSDYELDIERYNGTCMLGPRGKIIGGNIHDAVEWSKTGRGGMTYDLVKASIDANACSSRYGLCG
jgi:3'-phosphoadenosine 5'-phosphosulfate sulfotransferase (PAPS reductase)/FAD synthetase